jgi:hypothetical protein
MRVGRNAVDLHADFLEIVVEVGQVTQLRGTHEGEVGRIEHHRGPLALEVRFRDRDELAVVEGLRLERLYLGIDQRHVKVLFS